MALVGVYTLRDDGDYDFLMAIDNEHHLAEAGQFLDVLSQDLQNNDIEHVLYHVDCFAELVDVLDGEKLAKMTGEAANA